MNQEKSYIRDNRVYLRKVSVEDINNRYIEWLNDKETNQFMETRFEKQTYEAAIEYWRNMHKDLRCHWFAICDTETKTHIGNIKLGPINKVHKSGDISLFIGEKRFRGKGYASSALMKMIDFSFSELGLRKLNAGLYATNIKSKNLFLKSGFSVEGVLKEQVILEGKRVDVIKMGITYGHWRKL